VGYLPPSKQVTVTVKSVAAPALVTTARSWQRPSSKFTVVSALTARLGFPVGRQRGAP